MTHDNKGFAKPMVDHRQNMNDPAMNYSLQNGLLNRSYQTTTSWLVRGTLLITLALLFILPLYDLFTGTILDNIRYGRLNATDEECIEAAKLANAHDFIMRLPNKYDTVLSESGSNLSQGQRQLLSIA